MGGKAMNRGYVKLWRRAEDSCAWSRGIEYRGLLVTLFLRANYRETSFLGHKIAPGQVATSMQRLADDLGISRQKLIRMFSNLEKDGVLKVENSDNRFSRITMINYCKYQAMTDAPRTTDNTTDDTTPGQHPDISKKGKKGRSIKDSSYEESLSSEVSDNGSGGSGEKPKGGPPDCPHQQIIAIYREILPTLTAPRTWDGTRVTQLCARWRESWERLKKQGKPHAEPDVLGWWRRFFETVRECPLLMGQVDNRPGQAPFAADLVWLTKKSNFDKTLDGKYLPRRIA